MADEVAIPVTEDSSVAIPVALPALPTPSVFAGRRQIFSDIIDIDASNIETVVRKSMEKHLENAAEIQYLMDYERGITPIRNREKKGREDVNYKINENHAAEIKTFKVGYVFSSPITLTQRAQEEGDSDDKRVATLNEYLFEQGKAQKDKKLAEDFTTCGVGYRMALPKKYDDGGESPFDIINLLPQTTYVVYSNDVYKRPILGVSYVIRADGKRVIGAYTDTMYFQLEGGSLDGGVRLVSSTENGIGVVPIVEYRADDQRMGCFERVLDLLDGLSILTSDRVNGVAQFVNNILWADNVQATQEQQDAVKNGGWLFTKSDSNTKATVQFLNQQMDQSNAQALVDWAYDQILQITGTPAREKSSGGNTGQAIVLSNGWQIAETAAKNTEVVFKDSEYRFLNVILKILQAVKGVPQDMKTLKLSDIEIKFSRSNTDSLSVKVQALQGLLDAGIEPLTAIKTSSLFSDPQQVWVDSKPYIEEKRKVTTDDQRGNAAGGPERGGAAGGNDVPPAEQ